MIRLIWFGLVLTSFISIGAAKEQTTPTRFVQDRFAIGFWVDPPLDADAERRYREIADANFTLVIGGFGAATTETVQRQLELCERYGLKAIVGPLGRNFNLLAPDHPALWGYLWTDEPGAGAFPELAAEAAKVRKLRPGKFAYINLLPNYASAGALGTPTYDEHVAQFVDRVKPEVLSMDHYPVFRAGQPDGRASYLSNLEVMRKYSARAGIPFWNFFNTMPYGPHSDPTEGQLRWQIYASVAHGAKGVLYFCYYTPAGGEFPKGGAIIGRDDKPTRHYEQARRINRELKSLGPTLMKLTCTRTAHVKPDDTTAPLQGSLVTAISGDPAPDLLMGEFTHEDGRRGVLLQNHEFAYTSWPTVKFSVSKENVVEVSKVTGEEQPLRDDSPDMPGLQISLDAGDGRLFLMR